MPGPLVVAFSGHMTDAPGRARPRFPASKVEVVRRRIRDWLRAHGRRVRGVCSAARGSDLLFLEEVLSNGGGATVLLPFPAPAFKKISVGQGWDARFDAALAHDRVAVAKPLLDAVAPESEQEAAFERCNLAIVDEAEHLAAQLGDTDPILLTVWNGSPGDASGGTAHMVATWRDRGHQTENIDLSEL